MQEEGNLQGAIIVFKNALEKDPRDAEVRFLLADTYLAADHLDRAEREYRKAALQDPARVEVHLNLAELALRAGRADDALPEIQAYEKIRRPDPRSLVLSGRVEILKGRPADAEKIFRQALTLDPQYAPARRYLGEALFRQGRQDAARMELESVLNQDASDADTCLQLARLETAAGRTDAALKWYRHLKSLRPGHLEADYISGLILLDQGKVAEVEKIASGMLKAHPGLPEGLRLRGLVHFYNQRNEEAVIDLTQSQETGPDLTATYFLGLTNLRLGQDEMALNQFQRFLDYRPEAIQPRVMIAGILLKQKRVEDAVRELETVLKEDGQNAAALTLLGNARVAQGDLDGAMKAFDRAVAADPGLGEVFLRKGLVSLSRGDYKEAEESLVRSLAAEPDLVDSRLLLALGHLNKGDYDQAVEILESGLTGKPVDALLHNYLALACFKKKLPQEGIEHLEKAKELRPDYAASYENLARYWMEADEPEKALREYEALISRRPQDLGALLQAEEAAEKSGNLQAAERFSGAALKVLEEAGEERRKDLRLSLAYAEILERQRQWEKALAAYREICDRHPTFTPSLFALGSLHDRLGQKDEALEYYRKVLSLEPQNVPALNNLAFLYADRPVERAEGLDLARRAYRLAPESPWVLDTLGYVLVKSGKSEEAVPLLEKAASTLPTAATIHYNLALAYREQDRRTEAAASLRTALALGEFPGSEEARKILLELQGSGSGGRS